MGINSRVGCVFQEGNTDLLGSKESLGTRPGSISSCKQDVKLHCPFLALGIRFFAVGFVVWPL